LAAFFSGIGIVRLTPGVGLYAAVPASLLLLLSCGGRMIGSWALPVVVPGLVLLLLPMGVAGATWMVAAAEGRGQAGRGEREAGAPGAARHSLTA
jgi:hypothetical protein